MTNEATEREFILQDLESLTTDLPNGLAISDDGRLINWRGTNYIMQETVPADMTERELLIELVTLARGAVADMAEFSSKIAGNSILSKIFGVKSDKG